jgi:hypothetical protein
LVQAVGGQGKAGRGLELRPNWNSTPQRSSSKQQQQPGQARAGQGSTPAGNGWILSAGGCDAGNRRESIAAHRSSADTVGETAKSVVRPAANLRDWQISTAHPRPHRAPLPHPATSAKLSLPCPRRSDSQRLAGRLAGRGRAAPQSGDSARHLPTPCPPVHAGLVQRVQRPTPGACTLRQRPWAPHRAKERAPGHWQHWQAPQTGSLFLFRAPTLN